jgi:hypothetical protein
LLLRSRYAEKPALPDEIQSYDWFHYEWVRSDECTKADIDAAYDAIKILRENVKSCTILLRGVLRADEPPAPVDPADQSIGELDVFEQTLECRTKGLAPKTYRRVFCVKADVQRIVKAVTHDRSTRRMADTDVDKKVRDYIQNLPAKQQVNEKDLWDWAKSNIPRARREQVLESPIGDQETPRL